MLVCACPHGREFGHTKESNQPHGSYFDTANTALPQIGLVHKPFLIPPWNFWGYIGLYLLQRQTAERNLVSHVGKSQLDLNHNPTDSPCRPKQTSLTLKIASSAWLQSFVILPNKNGEQVEIPPFCQPNPSRRLLQLITSRGWATAEIREKESSKHSADINCR